MKLTSRRMHGHKETNCNGNLESRKVVSREEGVPLRPYFSSQGFLVWETHIAHETTVCGKQPTHSFTGDRKTWQILNRPTFKHVMFLRKCKEKQFLCGYKILTEGVFVIKVSNDAGITVWRIVWVTTNCFMSEVFSVQACIYYKPRIRRTKFRGWQNGTQAENEFL